MNISDNTKISEEINDFFCGYYKNLNIPKYADSSISTNNREDPILKDKNITKNRKSIKVIVSKYRN